MQVTDDLIAGDAADAIREARPGCAHGETSPECFHCRALCRQTWYARQGKAFCCQGCLTVFELLTENGLSDFYRLDQTPGLRPSSTSGIDQFRFLDEPRVRERLVDFSDQRLTRITFSIPAIHCLACVWLLENLFRLNADIGASRVNFLRKELAISFETGRIQLSAIVSLLASLGYEPELKLASLEGPPQSLSSRRLWLQLAVAGFAFGNTMLFSVAAYLGLDAFTGPAFRKFVGLVSLGLSIPVVTYSALGYWQSARASLRQRLLNIDVPIAAGIAALFAQSCYEVLSGRGEGYFDSLAGLLFFLLCGKLFQQKTYERLAFDRDYKSFLPLAVTRLANGLEERTGLAGLQIGDRLLIRNGELIPADSRLIEGPARIDYSFVTGESEPAGQDPGELLYAGGRQMGAAIEVVIVKPVSQSYLTSLWNSDAFQKTRAETLNAITNHYSQRFTKIVIGIATVSAAVWAFLDPALSLKAFTSVLIVACPCALALAAPFALGTAQRLLGRRQIFLKNPYVIETLARVDAAVFDKTGTLTAAHNGPVQWHGAPLTHSERHGLASLTSQSTHPLSHRITDALCAASPNTVPAELSPSLQVRSFLETAGCGIEGTVAGHRLLIGSTAWLVSRGLTLSAQPIDRQGSLVHVAIDGVYRGCFCLAAALRPETGNLLSQLSRNCELALLSGDNEKARDQFRPLFGSAAQLRFHQSPLNKLEFIGNLQRAGKTVMMTGDGLNDAGALRQSDVGVAVVENLGSFSPASDVIIEAGMVPRLANLLGFARQSMQVVRAAFLISSLYNIVGIGIAASGRLSPVVCAILMPLSSVTVVAFACGLTAWLGRRAGFASVSSPLSELKS